MIEIDEAVETEVPPGEVFDFIADPYNHVKFTPSLMDISDVEETDVGKRGNYAFKMVGARMEGRFEDETFDPPTERRYELTGDIEGTVAWQVEEVDDRSRVRYRSSIDPPGPDLLNTLTDPVAERFLTRDAASTLENLTVLLAEVEGKGGVSRRCPDTRRLTAGRTRFYASAVNDG